MNQEDFVRRLEAATAASLASPNLVKAERRQEAEEFLLHFRKSKSPFNTCRAVLEISKIDSVQFQATSTLKEAIITEWNTVDQATKMSIQEFILTYVTEKTELSGFVRESLSNVLAVMIKRGSIGVKDSSHRMPFYQHLASLISSGNVIQAMTACSILAALCVEFSASDKSSNVGVTWEQHASIKRKFEANDLLKIFELTIEVLHHVVLSDVTHNSKLCEKVLIILEQILNWHFISNKFASRRSILSRDSTIVISFQPVKMWSKIVFEPTTMQLFFKLHSVVRECEGLCVGSIMCLSQFASLKGEIFTDKTTAASYLNNYVQHFLHLFSREDLNSHEALGVSQIVRNLIGAHKLDVWSSIPQSLFLTFLQTVSHLTCLFGKKAGDESNDDFDEYMESYENILDCWTTLIEEMDQNDVRTFISPCAVQIVEGFVQCHVGENTQDNDEEYEELDEDDRVRFLCQLLSISSLARTTLHTVLPMLTSVLQDRINKLQNSLDKLHHDKNSSTTELNNVFENIHWLILLSGHILADECDGETALIPPEILHHSIQQKSDTKLLFTQPNLPEIISKCSDDVVRLVFIIVGVSNIESNALKLGLFDIMSPQLNIDLMWFFNIWGATYLVFPEEYYQQLSPALTSSFGQNSEGSHWLVNYLTTKVCEVFHYWVTEENVLSEAVETLHMLLGNQHRLNLVVENNNFWTLSHLFCSNDKSLSNVPISIQQALMTAIVITGSANMNIYKDKFFQQTLEPLQLRYKQLVGNPNFSNIYQEPQIQIDINNLLSLFRGVASASKPTNCAVLFNYLSHVLQDCSKLLDLYHVHEQIVTSILELFVEVIHKQICFLKTDCDYFIEHQLGNILLIKVLSELNDNSLTVCLLSMKYSNKQVQTLERINSKHHYYFLPPSLSEYHVMRFLREVYNVCSQQSQCSHLYEWAMSILKCYSKHNLGKRRTKSMEEDSFNELSLIMELLTNILNKDFIDFGENEESEVIVEEPDDVNAADVVLFGFSVIVPHITEELLLYPSLCNQYFKLVTFLCEIYPEKVEKLSPALLQSFVYSLELGMTAYGLDICKLCLEAVEGLALQCIRTKEQENILHQATLPFMKHVFDAIIVHANDLELLRCAGETFYTILCFKPDQASIVFSQVIEGQSDPALKQRLSEGFQALIPDIHNLSTERLKRTEFLKNLEHVIFNIRGILFIK